MAVIEAEWLACTDPREMLAFLRGKASERKLRLFGVACCRRIWHLLGDGRSRHVVEVVERYEDGAASDEEMDEAAEAADDASEAITHSGGGWSADTLARHAAAWLSAADYPVSQVASEVAAFAAKASAAATEAHAQCQYARDIFGDPFRPPSLVPAVLAWNDATVVRLAQAAYDERDMPAGTLDNGRLAVLPDALAEAGCSDADILGHLWGGPGPHVRGCWVVDQLLGKE
jgi:hypothetical protein